ncbi:MAG TPA: ATP-binding protein [Bryobacteraceae bacterium]|nr:ATP-binding protein [Bryobacteraceae bacterium]
MTSIVTGKMKGGLNGWLHSVIQYLCALALPWLIARICFGFQSNRATCAMLLLLVVLMVSTLGNSLLALMTAVSSSLAFSWFFVEVVGSLRISTAGGMITFLTMAVTALTCSQLSARAERRAQEAIRRREEMERLQQLGSVLLAAVTVSEAAARTVRKLVSLFDLDGAVLRIEGDAQVYQAGNPTTGSLSIIPLNAGTRADLLEIYGSQPSAEVRSALASMISLVIERARTSEEKTRIETTQRGEELRSTVLNALAHSFKTPLTSIKAAASMLRASRDLTSPPERELAVVIDEEADRLDQLITESLDLERIESHRANPRREECRIAEVVRSATARLSRFLGRREVVIDVPEDLPTIMADKFLLDQMLLQVLDNAGKYSKPGSTIRISAEKSRRDIVITIQNEGSEIPPGERQLIFDKFYRGSQNRTTTEGTGLGLAIAKTIAEAYNGRLWLDAEPEGPAFRFALPIEMAEGAIKERNDYQPYDFADRR